MFMDYQTIVRMAVLKLIRFNAIPNKIPAFFGGEGVETDKLILKFMWKYKGP